jgi:hypothetical protein
MLNARSAGITFIVIGLLAVGSATFRIVTAPERMAQRRAADALACSNGGGTMTKVGTNDVCVKKDGS